MCIQCTQSSGVNSGSRFNGQEILNIEREIQNFLWKSGDFNTAAGFVTQ